MCTMTTFITFCCAINERLLCIEVLICLYWLHLVLTNLLSVVTENWNPVQGFPIDSIELNMRHLWDSNPHLPIACAELRDLTRGCLEVSLKDHGLPNITSYKYLCDLLSPKSPQGSAEIELPFDLDR